MFDSRLPPRSRRELRCSELLRSCVVITPYRRFGANYRPHIEGSRILTVEDSVRQVVQKRR